MITGIGIPRTHKSMGRMHIPPLASQTDLIVPLFRLAFGWGRVQHKLFASLPLLPMGNSKVRSFNGFLHMGARCSSGD
jgi:hypothetical protein